MRKFILALVLAACVGAVPTFAGETSTGNTQAIFTAVPTHDAAAVPVVNVQGVSPAPASTGSIQPLPVAPAITWQSPELWKLIIEVALFLIGIWYVKADANKKDMIQKGLGSAHVIIDQLKSAGVIKSGTFSTVEEEFFKRWQDRFVIDHGQRPDLNAENAAFKAVAQEFSATPKV